MDIHLSALLMFLLLSYLLFRRPASTVSRRYPTELGFQIGHSVLLQKELLKGNSATASFRDEDTNYVG
jgi:hypothetical protein